MATTLKGKAPGHGSGEMSHRTASLRPALGLDESRIRKARDLRRQGHEPDAIAQALNAPVDEVERALLQMRSRRPESTRGTLNVTLKAHELVLAERHGDEPLWATMDRLLGELLQLRTVVGPGARMPEPRRKARPRTAQAVLDL